MLTKEKRKNIVESLENRKFLNWYKGLPEHTMNFEECSDEDLIYYRDEWLSTEFDLNDEEELECMSVWYDENIHDYWQ